MNLEIEDIECEFSVQHLQDDDYAQELIAEIADLRAENERLKAELKKRAKQLGVACLEHDLTNSLTCGHCEDDLKVENERLTVEVEFLLYHIDGLDCRDSEEWRALLHNPPAKEQ